MAQSICTVDGCDRPVIGWGWCTMHYQRWYHKMRKGLAADFRLTVEERLLAQRTINADGCWIWTGGVIIGNHSAEPYGHMSVDGRQRLVHRIAHKLWIGPIPDGYQVDHVAARGCRSTLCFNPAHLEAVTAAVNTLRSTAPTAVNAQKTACVHGHPFDEANTYRKSNGGRDCRECNRLRAARNRQRRYLTA